MKDEDRTKKQLIRELVEMRQRVAELETWETERERIEETLQKRAALDRMRATVLSMRTPEDIQDVLMELHRQLREVGIRFGNGSVQVIDEERWESMSYHVTSEGIQEVRTENGSLLPLYLEQNRAIAEAWREQRVVYRPDLDREDRYGEREHIQGDGGYRSRIRSVVDIPFSRGTIAINSLQPDAFPEADIETLKQFAEVLSGAYTRFEDIQRIEASEEKYRNMVEHSQDALFKIDLEGNYLLVSPVIQEVTGYSPEEFYADRGIGRRIVLPEDFEKSEEGFRKASSGEVSSEVEYRVRTKDGGILWVSQNTFPIRDARGRIVAIEGTIRDITEHKRWHEIERMRYRIRAIQEPEEWTELLRMLDEVLTNCGVEFKACGVNIVNMEKRTMQMYTFEDHQLRTTDFQGPTVPVIETVVREHRTIYRPDTLVPDEFEEGFAPSNQGMERRSVVDVPFAGGTVAMSSPSPDAFSERDIETLEKIADVISEGYTRYMDLTEHKRAEEALKKSEEKYRTLVETIEEGIGIVDEKENFAFVNRAAADIFGYSEEELIGKNLKELTTPEEFQRILDQTSLRKAGKSSRYELTVIRKDGASRIITMIATPIIGDDRKYRGSFGIFQDITERKRAEEALRNSEERYRAIFEQAAASIVLVDAETGALVEFNDSAHEHLGYTREEFKELKIPDFEVMESGEEVAKHIEKIVNEGADTFETRHRTKDGEIRDIQVSSRAISIGGRDFVQSIWRDITEHKRAGDRMAALNEITRIVNASLDIKEVYEAFLAQVAKLVAFDRSAIAVPDASGECLIPLAYTFDVPTPQYETKNPFRGTGMEWAFEHLIPLYEPDLEKERRFSESQVLFEKGSRSYVVIPLIYEGKVIGALSLASRKPNAYSKEDLALLEQIAGQLTTAVRNAQLFEETRQRAEKLSSQAEALEHAYGALQQAQEQLIQTEKLRALGEMASGVAHDFNNLLGGILGRTQLMLMHPEDKEDVERGLKLIERAALDGAKTVRRIQEFSRIRRDKIPGWVDVNEVVRGAVEITRPKWKDQAQRAGVTIVVEMDLGEIGPVEGSGSELREALVNMILNAVDAMPDGGTIRLKTERKEDADGVGQWVCLSLSDTGIGMSKEIQQRVFDPFFSTKGVKGDGLGLSMAYGIVTRHGGRISVDSAEGQGTTFTIELPVASDAQEIRGGQAPTTEIKPMRILVIEDEESIRLVLSEMLESMGYHVSTASSGREGMERFGEEAFDVVLTDLGMPEMSGWEVAKAVKELSPATFVFLVTGWGVELSQKQLQESGVHAVIAKPFKMADLSRKIAEIAELKTMNNEQ